MAPGATMRPLAVGSGIPAAPVVYTATAEAVSLHQLWADRPALIVTGSLTCPPSRIFNPALNRLQQQFGSRAHVCLLYVIDAHPADSACPYTGTEWLTEDNEADGLFVSQPVTLDERMALARRFAERVQLETAVYVDGMDNAGWDALGRSPNMAALIGTDGRCRFYQAWLMPDALAAALETELGD